MQSKNQSRKPSFHWNNDHIFCDMEMAWVVCKETTLDNILAYIHLKNTFSPPLSYYVANFFWLRYNNGMRKRLDVVLTEKGLYQSREKAKQAIEMQRVKVGGRVETKPSTLVEQTDMFEVLPFEFVSRGGFKLQKAIEDFKINLEGKVVLDIGASTGGFSDVCLQNGAKKIYAVDTGEGQLVDKIKNDKRVFNFEKTNYLTFDKANFSDVNFVVIDVSFVSLTKLVPKLASDFEHVEIVALIKPQFEVGAEYARKHKGVVKDQRIHEKIIEKIKNNFENYNFNCKNITKSPITGGDGNIEFLIYLKK